MLKEIMDKVCSGWEGDCPTCGKYLKMYHRRIHSAMAVQLIQLYRIGGAQEYIHVRRLMIRGSSGIGDFSKCAYWKLIEEQPNDDAQKRTSGCWKLTQLGVQFVNGEVNLPKYAMVYDAHILGFTGQPTSIRQCLNNKFNYEELMGGA